MKLHQATTDELKDILDFYDYVIGHTNGIEVHAQWHKGKHPTAEDIRAYIQGKNGWLDFYFFEYEIPQPESC